MAKSIEDQFTQEEINFGEENMTHISAEEFLSRLDDSVDNYIPIRLSVSYLGGSDLDFVYVTELRLARKALKKDCKYVSDMDYCQFDPDKKTLILVATGLKKQISNS